MVIKPVGLVEAQLSKANIGMDYWECDFVNYKGPSMAKHATKKYLIELQKMKSRGVGIMYAGPNGPGKTTLSMITAKYLLRANWNVFCTSLGELVEEIQKSWNTPGDDTVFTDRCRGADFLFIDDLGKEHRGASGFVQTVFDNLIRHRMQKRQPTFLTTNLTKSEIQATYGESVVSLLEGKIMTVVVNGEDYRKTTLKTQNKDLLK